MDVHGPEHPPRRRSVHRFGQIRTFACWLWTGCLNDDAWKDLQQAMESPLFAGPVTHFLVRAFASDGIDEFLAHIVTIEAALGREADRKSKKGATALVAHRLAVLLDDAAAGKLYIDLFDTRCGFIHGRAMDDIPGASRLEARRLARRCVCALIEASIAEPPPSCRDKFLDELAKASLTTGRMTG